MCLLLRYAAYEIDPAGAGVDSKGLIGLHELLLSADPSGMDGRPGSADAVTGKPRYKL